MWYNLPAMFGADHSFRRVNFDNLFCRSRILVKIYNLIATFIAKAKSFASDVVSGFASAFQMPALAIARI